MAVAVEDVVASTALNTGCELTLPNGIPADGDLIVVLLMTNSNEDTQITSAGFTIDTAWATTDRGGGEGTALAYRYASSEASATYDFGTSGFQDVGLMMVLSGVDGTTPFESSVWDAQFKHVIYGTVEPGDDPDGTTTTPTGISVTADGMVLALSTRTNTPGNHDSLDPGAGYTLQTSATPHRAYAYTKPVTTTGTEPGQTITSTPANRDHFAHFVAVSPAAGGGGGPQTWVGTTPSLEVSPTSGSFTPGPIAWAGSTGQVSGSPTSGAFVDGGSPQTWEGSTGKRDVLPSPVSGSFSPGPATWVGTTSSAAATPISGAFGATGSPQTWAGSISSVAVTPISGVFVDGGAPQSWVGSASSATAIPTSDSFTPGSIIWVGSTLPLEASSTSGSFAPGVAAWTGSEANVALVPDSGEFEADGALTWSGSGAFVQVSSSGSSFTGGPVTWQGSQPADVDGLANSGIWVIPSQRVGAQAILVI